MIPLILLIDYYFPGIDCQIFCEFRYGLVKDSSVWIQSHLSGSSSLYVVLYFVLVVAFTYFYTSVTFMNNDYGSSLKKQGAVVPGRAAGTETQKYLAKIQNRITLPGAVMLGVIAVLPEYFGCHIAYECTSDDVDVIFRYADRSRCRKTLSITCKVN